MDWKKSVNGQNQILFTNDELDTVQNMFLNYQEHCENKIKENSNNSHVLHFKNELNILNTVCDHITYQFNVSNDIKKVNQMFIILEKMVLKDTKHRKKNLSMIEEYNNFLCKMFDKYSKFEEYREKISEVYHDGMKRIEKLKIIVRKQKDPLLPYDQYLYDELFVGENSEEWRNYNKPPFGEEVEDYVEREAMHFNFEEGTDIYSYITLYNFQLKNFEVMANIYIKLLTNDEKYQSKKKYIQSLQFFVERIKDPLFIKEGDITLLNIGSKEDLAFISFENKLISLFQEMINIYIDYIKEYIEMGISSIDPHEHEYIIVYKIFENLAEEIENRCWKCMILEQKKTVF